MLRVLAPLALLALTGVVLAACTRARDPAPVPFVDSGQDVGAGNSLCVATEDIDGDGDRDVLVANDDTASILWINDGRATFARGRQEFPSATCAALADLDGDGDVDALLTNDQSLVLLNDGTGNLSLAGAVLITPGAVDAALGDLDGDRDVDVVIAAWGHPEGLPNQVWLNVGDGSFVLGPHAVGTAVSVDVALGDVDADGDLDVLIANQADANHDPVPDELWLNDGDGGFADSGLRLGRSSTHAVRLADLDGDGDLDAVAANTSHAGKSDPANTVWLNDGAGCFIDSGQRLGAVYSLGLALGDLDNDGDLDAYVGNYQTADHVWLNDGSGGFTDSGLLLGAQNGHAVALADLDGDGDLDVFVANNTWQGGDGRNSIWLNQ
ncbi:MAG: hypothetical protein GTO61_10010 [Gemmatimonadales bacterium]|nr:hypothetical protein [Gemmatimonadales bacterium]NIO31546.1 hypothetical protein [Gemmatimonadota bacterium]